MKYMIVVLLALAATSYASKTQDQILALLQTGTKASDAIDTVFGLLNDLKQFKY
ncbi:unnamed protein product (macronuclear) [Paramecium tetraurelia]|uniref:Uncharacterized protein n=1 Tax=Paramecium tetraurelia TaxID=5888 RepID=A0E7X6_PARTE|nr:uncharacterized protein GSPATT00024121001 [Paramecium tetraurelia]CAK91393.1 unnamed protein product [Paramecium tetraurelia]|eukprot:XP_001458790.1 hypothetical protein (macronuclear) [Paramecium tetraurelia strain d4-2]